MSAERDVPVLSADEHRELDRLARGLRRADPELAGLLTAPVRRRPRPPRPLHRVLGVLVVAALPGGAGIVVAALGCSDARWDLVLYGAGLIGLCLAVITWLTAAPRGVVTPRRGPRAGRPGPPRRGAGRGGGGRRR